MKRISLVCLLIGLSSHALANGYTVRYYNGVATPTPQTSQAVIQKPPTSTNQTAQADTAPKLIIQESKQAANTSNWMTSVGNLNQAYHDEVRKAVEGLEYQQPTQNRRYIASSTAYHGSARQSTSANKNTYDQLIRQIASKYGVETGLVKAIMHTESSFNSNARSPVGAQGLMQLMPATARRFKVVNAYDPSQNIEGGVKYLSWLINRFGGDVRLALAGYNAGEGNVDKYGGIPPFRETQDYVKKVLTRYNALYKHSL